MCNEACIDFARRVVTKDDVADKTVLELGSLSTTGSVRPCIEKLKPRRYLGVDIVEGPGVDEVCDASDIVEVYGAGSFDVVLATELIEHVRDWRRIIHNIKAVLKPGGAVLITTRSYGFHYHPNPEDFWRYEAGDMEMIFSDFTIEQLERDPISPGVFLKARKPGSSRETDLSHVALYSLITGRRACRFPSVRFFLFRLRRGLRRGVSFLLPGRVKDVIKGRRGV